MLALAVVDTWRRSAAEPPTDTLRGVVIAVDGPDLARVQGFTLRSADGSQVRFAVESLSLAEGGKPAPHLREHLVSGQPIVVEYRLADDGSRVALRYRDAPD